MKSIQSTVEAGSAYQEARENNLKCLLSVQEKDSVKEQVFNTDEMGLLCKNVVNENI